MINLFRISACRYINDFSGTGAATYGGRWHSKGTHVLYTAATPSLALLESVVHIGRIIAADYCLLSLSIPDDSILSYEEDRLPEHWRSYPSPDELKAIGDIFINANKFLALKIPSALMPEEYNYLLNPVHKDFSKIKVLFSRKVMIDSRLVSGGW